MRRGRFIWLRYDDVGVIRINVEMGESWQGYPDLALPSIKQRLPNQ